MDKIFDDEWWGGKQMNEWMNDDTYMLIINLFTNNRQKKWKHTKRKW